MPLKQLGPDNCSTLRQLRVETLSGFRIGGPSMKKNKESFLFLAHKIAIFISNSLGLSLRSMG